VAEIAAELAGSVDRDIADKDIVGYYVTLMQDKEPEVRSEAILKLPELSKHCNSSAIVENILPVMNSFTVNDSSQHVKGSLATVISELASFVG